MSAPHAEPPEVPKEPSSDGAIEEGAGVEEEEEGAARLPLSVPLLPGSSIREEALNCPRPGRLERPPRPPPGLEEDRPPMAFIKGSSKSNPPSPLMTLYSLKLFPPRSASTLLPLPLLLPVPLLWPAP
jgi:hypothetical protein